jgi:hypothetical protein
MLKRLELASPTSCLNRAQDDEPVFVLRAKDPIAAGVVRAWAQHALDHHEGAKIDEALALAEQMEAWRLLNVGGQSRTTLSAAGAWPFPAPKP